MLRSLFNKISRVKVYNIKRRLRRKFFSNEYNGIFKNSFSNRTPPVAAAVTQADH